MTVLDPRLNAFRPDLADEALRGQVSAPRFVAAKPARVVDAIAPLRRAPRFDAPLDTELLFGEPVGVLDEAEGWAWVKCGIDGYVGYVPADALGPSGEPPTHRIVGLRTYVYPGPDIKAPPLRQLSLGSRMTVHGEHGPFVKLIGGGFVHRIHVAPLTDPSPDFVAVAERFLGTPYLWGGRSSLGLDCSGLVQLAMQAAGLPCPRDSDMQEAALGVPLEFREHLPPLRRGDLVFWKGHVGIMADAHTLLHANASFMEVTLEPLSSAIARTAAAGAQITSIRRPAVLGATASSTQHRS